MKVEIIKKTNTQKSIDCYQAILTLFTYDVIGIDEYRELFKKTKIIYKQK